MSELSDNQHEDKNTSGTDKLLMVKVQVQETEASERCALKTSDDYQLHVHAQSILLYDVHSEKLHYEWPYRYIRRFGRSKTQFLFEAGRKCSSGDGLFKLICSQPDDIFKLVHQHMDMLKAPPVPQKTEMSRYTLLIEDDPPQIPLPSKPVVTVPPVDSTKDNEAEDSLYESVDALVDRSEPQRDYKDMNMSELIGKMAESNVTVENHSEDLENVYDEAMCFGDGATKSAEPTGDNVYG